MANKHANKNKKQKNRVATKKVDDKIDFKELIMSLTETNKTTFQITMVLSIYKHPETLLEYITQDEVDILETEHKLAEETLEKIKNSLIITLKVLRGELSEDDTTVIETILEVGSYVSILESLIGSTTEILTKIPNEVTMDLIKLNQPIKEEKEENASTAN